MGHIPNMHYLHKAAFDEKQCKSSLFGHGDAATTIYRCSQSIFQCDTLFNPDPSAKPSVSQKVYRGIPILVSQSPSG